MKKLSKKIFLLPLCALIANPFSAAFAVKYNKAPNTTRISNNGYGKKHTRKSKPKLVMIEKEIEGCCKSDKDLDTVFANRFNDFINFLLDSNVESKFFVKSGLLFVIMDEGFEESAAHIFRDRHDLKEVVDEQIAKCSDLIHRVNLSEGDKGCLNFIFTTWIADIVKDLSKYPKEERAKRFVEEFTRRLMSSDEVRSVCDNYPCGNELLNFLFDVAHINLDNNSKLSMYPLFHCLRMLLA